MERATITFQSGGHAIVNAERRTLAICEDPDDVGHATAAVELDSAEAMELAAALMAYAHDAMGEESAEFVEAVTGSLRKLPFVDPNSDGEEAPDGTS